MAIFILEIGNLIIEKGMVNSFGPMATNIPASGKKIKRTV
jgi:hypothetical protein